MTLRKHLRRCARRRLHDVLCFDVASTNVVQVGPRAICAAYACVSYLGRVASLAVPFLSDEEEHMDRVDQYGALAEEWQRRGLDRRRFLRLVAMGASISTLSGIV